MRFVSAIKSIQRRPTNEPNFTSNEASLGGSGESGDQPAARSFAAFICHIAHLEKRLRADDSVFFDATSEVIGSRLTIGEGTSFRVERAEWKKKSTNVNLTGREKRQGKFVALKSLKYDDHEQQQDWKNILLEIRALLHEPLRYHPNIVYLLGIGWGPTAGSDSIYPQLVVEYSTYGSLRSLQESREPLSFPIKQKLCYDVARGLSILHACGIVHGDLKHENVLIYDNQQAIPGLPFTAKLADFGGSVMDITYRTSHFWMMSTWPYAAPEINGMVSVDRAQQTDVYSFGLLVWRAIIDGRDIVSGPEFEGRSEDKIYEDVERLKSNNEFLQLAKNSVMNYAVRSHICADSIALISYVLDNTVQVEQAGRNLPKAQSALRGMALNQINGFLQRIQEMNRLREEADANEPPGKHGISADSLGYHLGQMGDGFDAQNNTPGYRPSLSHPEAEEFFFEPLRLKSLLNWPQQVYIFQDLERAAISKVPAQMVELRPFIAAYYLFQCYLTEFGVVFDAQKACEWLLQAAGEEEASGVNYYAQAWIWRISDALRVPLPLPGAELETHMGLSIMRGHRNCLNDAKTIVEKHLITSEDKRSWNERLNIATLCLNTWMGGNGMPYFIPRRLLKPYDLDNLVTLDNQIREELGLDYVNALRETMTVDQDLTGIHGRTRSIDSIYVNNKGYGLLHYAAAMGNLIALQHLLNKYRVNIDLPNQHCEETPLVLACRTGHLACAMGLLSAGASPHGNEHGQESPLHWLCCFQEDEMAIIANRLIAAGAVVDSVSGSMRADVRGVWADWESMLEVSVTPLGRCVMMENLPAVKVLLGLGADPFIKVPRGADAKSECAVEIAALLTLPDILTTLLSHIDGKRYEERPVIFDEANMLQAAHARRVLPYDSLTFQSRLVRCGRSYYTVLFETLKILHDRREEHSGSRANELSNDTGKTLCAEVRLGNTDIVECLLKLGHSANGSPGSRPIKNAVLLNHVSIFYLLIEHGATMFTEVEDKHGNPITLLQASACRPKTSRPGTLIAESLIEAGIPVERPFNGKDSDNECPTAFVLAVQNQYFDLADLLLSKGANINVIYREARNKTQTTVLGELVQHHTERSLKSIEFLLRDDSCGCNKYAATTSETDDNISPQLSTFQLNNNLCPHFSNFIPVPSPSPDSSSNLSLLQLLALSFWPLNHSKTSQSNLSQISSRITDALLSSYHSPSQINHVHPIYGSALCLASLSGNLDLVSVLLDHQASQTITADLKLFPPGLTVGLQWGKNDEGTPVFLAVTGMIREVTQAMQHEYKIPSNIYDDHTVSEPHPPPSQKKWSRVKSYISVVELLIKRSSSPLPSMIHSNLTAAKEAVEKNIILYVDKPGTLGGNPDAISNDSTRPIDLSGLAEQRNIDGVWEANRKVMDAELAVRTMFKFLRGGG